MGGTTTLASLDSLTKNDTAGWRKAIDAAAAADAVVMVLGIDGSIEGESNDRTSIDLPAVQHAFAAAVAALGKPTVVVLLHGGSIDTTAERDAPGVGAILDAFYPGMKGAEAIASTIFGDNDRLGGKMALCVQRAQRCGARCARNCDYSDSRPTTLNQQHDVSRFLRRRHQDVGDGA